MSGFDLRSFLKSLTTRPGIYRMFDGKGNVLYVGKAKNLRNRVRSYFSGTPESAKTRALVANVDSVEVIVTDTEAEALLLENNLIKEFRPKYNILFRDDKSYPYLYLSADDNYPRLSFYRGPRKSRGKHYGPFPDVSSARRTVNHIQKLFRLRQCDDAFFRNRSRPCLQYQIKRCSAPCVGYIDADDYAKDVEMASLYLEGKNEVIIESLLTPMKTAAANLQFEKAARYRDQITSLRSLQNSRNVHAGSGKADVIGCAIQSGQACIQLFCIRDGRNLGSRSYYSRVKMDETPADIIGTFIQQYYFNRKSEQEIPDEIYVSHKPKESRLLTDVFKSSTGKAIKIRDRARKGRAGWIPMAEGNARISLAQRLSRNLEYQQQLDQLRELLDIDVPVERIECFDISHISGDLTVASCVVYGNEGAIKQDYRRYNIEAIKPGDDYAAMRQVINRRYTRLKKEEGRFPDLILIDGGKGQVKQAGDALIELQADDSAVVLGIAKGPSRKPGLETLILSRGNRVIRLQPDSVLLHLLQEIRDEAHHFAITGHRRKRKLKQRSSHLTEIEGVGNRRRQQLIQYFGGIQGVERAGLQELAKVPGISVNLARRIYETFHNK